jgi:homoserine acetyltransferase
MCPDYLIETYLDHQGERFCLQYDANSWLYISKAMDMFDISESAQRSLAEKRHKAHGIQDPWATRLLPVLDATALEDQEAPGLPPTPPVDTTDDERADLVRGLSQVHLYWEFNLTCSFLIGSNVK